MVEASNVRCFRIVRLLRGVVSSSFASFPFGLWIRAIDDFPFRSSKVDCLPIDFFPTLEPSTSDLLRRMGCFFFVGEALESTADFGRGMDCSGGDELMLYLQRGLLAHYGGFHLWHDAM